MYHVLEKVVNMTEQEIKDFETCENERRSMLAVGLVPIPPFEVHTTIVLKPQNMVQYNIGSIWAISHDHAAAIIEARIQTRYDNLVSLIINVWTCIKDKVSHGEYIVTATVYPMKRYEIKYWPGITGLEVQEQLTLGTGYYTCYKCFKLVPIIVKDSLYICSNCGLKYKKPLTEYRRYG